MLTARPRVARCEARCSHAMVAAGFSGQRVVGQPVFVKRQDDPCSPDRNVPMQGAQLAIGVLAGILVLQLQHTDLTVRSGSTSSQPRISSQTDSNGSMRVRYVRSPSEFFVRRYLRCGVGGAARWTNQLTLDTR